MASRDELMALFDDKGHLHIHVTPKSSSDRIRVEPRDDGTVQVRVYVTCAPEDGKANKAVFALLSKVLGVPKTTLTIIRGETGRDKTVRIGE